jgi:hypothetical protein
MPFTINPQPGEEVYLARDFRGSHDHKFAMAVSNQAVYVSAQTSSFTAAHTYGKRIPLNEVRAVQLRKQRDTSLLLISAGMFIFGLALSVLMMWKALDPGPGGYTVSGWPFAITIGGLVIPFVGRGRKSLVVMTQDAEYKWTPQLSIDKKTRNSCAELQHEVLAACRRAGIITAEV